MNTKKIILNLIALLLFSISVNSFACSCMMPESPKIELEKSSKVFIWRVLSVQKEKWLNELMWWMNNNIVNLEVKANIKWVEQKEISLTTAESSAACWYNFKKDKEYIVYAWEYDWKITASLCSRTNLIENASEDLQDFEKLIINNQSNNNIENKNIEKTKSNEVFTNKLSKTTYILIIILIGLLIGIIKMKITKKHLK